MAPKEVFSYDLSSGENMVDMTFTDYSAFTSTDMIDFLFRFRAGTIIHNSIGSDRAYFANASNTGAWGKIVATYSHEPAPEPGALALLAAGLFGIGLRRKRGKYFPVRCYALTLLSDKHLRNKN
ncbi:PEP-CTERM sorting domain-containing protein [Thalassomonas haliotis]|uniref:PEP-CTERM sorting domain-containing protein n=2 Tax=Thalassomonas haliotis TaxID=485448 RepID=A0ABY7V7Y9_9GAMM|nr:PEP-CTERM sorting domain-containing protein [Thalassomonas haliotis]